MTHGRKKSREAVELLAKELGLFSDGYHIQINEDSKKRWVIYCEPNTVEHGDVNVIARYDTDKISVVPLWIGSEVPERTFAVSEIFKWLPTGEWA